MCVLHITCHPGALSLQLEFDERCHTESGCDKLRLGKTKGEAANGNIRMFDGHFGGETLTIEGERFWLYFYSDSSTEYWGYKITVKAVMPKLPPVLPLVTTNSYVEMRMMEGEDDI